ncbi:alpha-E domain-containing protein, partial [Yersinia enterocolitica]
MLSRTASELYWMARYLERAENITRVLDVTNRLSMMPTSNRVNFDLLVPLSLSNTQVLFAEHYPQVSMT